jgi:hypothetical protein
VAGATSVSADGAPSPVRAESGLPVASAATRMTFAALPAGRVGVSAPALTPLASSPQAIVKLARSGDNVWKSILHL